MSFPPLIVLVLALVLAVPPARATPPVPVATPSAVPRFTLFGWVAPPVWEQTAARYQELAATGMNAAVLAWEDPQLRESNLARLDLAAAVGIRCLIADHRFERVRDLGIDTPEAGVVIDSIVSDYRDHPGFLGYYLGDEPKSDQWPVLSKVFAELRARDPEHPAWNNLSGYTGFDSLVWVADHVGYLEHIRPAVLCNDHYDFRTYGDIGRFVANVAGLRAWSLAYGVPFWCIVQLVPHANVRPLSEGELAWQVSMLLAYGTRGIGYFTYWTPAPDPSANWGDAMITYDGVRTPWYDIVARMNTLVRPAGETLAGLTWISTQHAGSQPRGGQPFRGDDWLTAIAGRAAVGRFTDAAGVPHLLVMNADSLSARDVTLTLTGAAGVARLGTAIGDWRALPVVRRGEGIDLTLALGAGEFALLRIDGTFTDRRGRLGPVLAVSPSPARDEVRFDVARVAGEARIEIVDATGRRVWLRRLPAGNASLVWHGEQDAGGRAPAGVYVARVDDTRGTTTRRWSWLGGR